tara:strand:+ start:782 stop:1039 length:258 start_codon:yes stop_codon:yes gene_type:complete
MGEVIQFPNVRKVVEADKRDRMEHRLSELETENSWIKADIQEMGRCLETNIKEMQQILRDLAKIEGFEEGMDLSYDDSDDLEPDF